MGLESADFIDGLVPTNPVGNTDDASQGDNHLRLIKSALKQSFPKIIKATYLQVAAVEAASSATTNLGGVQSDNVRITGTNNISSFGTAAAGTIRRCYFAASLTLTHSSALLLPGAADIVTAADDRLFALSLGSGNWIVLVYQRASGKALIAPSFAELTGLADLAELDEVALDDLLLIGDESDDGATKKLSIETLLLSLALLDEKETPLGTDFVLGLDSEDDDRPKKFESAKLSVAQAAMADLAPGTLLGILEDQRSAGSNGGGSTSGSWITRTLNTEVYDRLDNIELLTNQFTLPAGEYDITYEATFRGSGSYKLRLLNVTDTEVLGSGSLTGMGSGNASITVPLTGVVHVSIDVSKTFALQYRVTSGTSGDGLGGTVGDIGISEVYARVVIRKG